LSESEQRYQIQQSFDLYDEDLLSVPFTSNFDNKIKNILIKTISNETKVGDFVITPEHKIPELIQIIKHNATIDGLELSDDEISFSLYKIDNAKILIRRKKLIIWHLIPWITMHIFNQRQIKKFH